MTHPSGRLVAGRLSELTQDEDNVKDGRETLMMSDVCSEWGLTDPESPLGGDSPLHQEALRDWQHFHYRLDLRNGQLRERGVMVREARLVSGWV